jgi:probable HAF family extracellular repeat protein
MTPHSEEEHMRNGALSRVKRVALIAMLAVPFTGLAQTQSQEHRKKHKHYTLVDLGTLGGPNSFLNGGSVLINPSGAVVATADTSVYDPGCDCYIDHAVEWHKGVLTDLGTLPGGANSLGNSINSRGAVSGWSENGLIDPVSGLPAIVATIWSHGQVRDLGTLGGSFSGAIGVNDRGQAAGFAGNTILDLDGFSTLLFLGASIPTTQWHAALWQRDGTIEDLGTLGGPASFAIFVNEHGQVAGLSYTDSVPNPETGMPTVAPFIWENGQMTNLGSFGGPCAETAGLNSRGQVAGTSCTETWAHAYRWYRGTMQDLGTLGGTFSRADGLNDNGEVIGQSSLAGDQTFDGYLWRNAVMTDLGSMAGDCGSNAISINAKSQIVGESFSCDGDANHPYIWENGDPMVDLNTLVVPGSEILVHEPLFISDQGEIVGSGDLPNGDQHAVLLIPKKSDGDADGDDDAFAVSQNDVAPAPRSATAVTRPAPTSGRVAELRARLANRFRFGLRPQKKAN